MPLKNIVIFALISLCFSCKEKRKKPDFIYPAPTSIEKVLLRGHLDISTFYSTTDYYVYKGIPRGFHYDLAKDFASFLGIDLHIVEINNNIDSLIHHLEEGKFDLIAVSMTETPERKEKLNFSNPFFKTGEVLVQNKNNTILRDAKELDGKTVFIKKDSPYRKLVQQLEDSLNIHIKISEITDYSSEDILHLVETGEIRLTVMDENIAKALSTSMKNLDYSLRLNNSISVAWATPAADSTLTEEINRWLIQVKKSGKLNYLYKRYFNNSANPTSKYTLLKKGDISPFDEELKKESKFLDWDWRLLAALIYNESRFDPEAESQVGAYGLMQVIPETASMFNVFDYFQPDSNIYTGVRYLKYLDNIFLQYPIAEKEKIKFTLASYNVGAGHVKDAMRLTQKYNKDPYKWDNNVAFYLQHKSDPEYYRDSLSFNGYCDGQQAVDYVRKVLETYNNYKHIKR
ncbi:MULTISPECIES: transporter substrate-binding domain-containing protein [Culturomica]|jgi:membrane-bound lytic murein transglycosylase F|uniref:transporter substrate-binding domain-containing protein n=1 Tax=Culturomica TaxID=1926651 RepID=UPI00083882A4|nr:MULTISPECIES: transporter substrate-binding domain-containing protein [Odoribacteraceae]RHV90876.1 lytic transglycosylase F [Odoribacter sp. OF09-27XD]HBO27542.1 lytic transglycosylase F [Culturomica sp.]